MANRNPIKSMSGNMWHALRRLRTTQDSSGIRRSTLRALESRSLVYECQYDGAGTGDYCTYARGDLICDAFTEGQESVR